MAYMLLCQGNTLQDLFQKTSKNLSIKRVDREIHHLKVVIEAIKRQELNENCIAEAIVNQCLAEMDNRQRLLCASLRPSFQDAFIVKLKGCIKKILTCNPKSRIYAYRCLQLSRRIDDYKYIVQTICRCLDEDQKIIQQSLGYDIFADLPITADMEAGDPHLHGLSTTIITLTSGRRLVYKPRDMGLEKTLKEDLHISSIPNTIACNHYGYQEFIPSQAPSNATAQVMGSLMATLDVLGATDLHNDNLILDSQRAWIIDGEAILHRFSNQKLRKNSTTPPLGDSILSMGIISPPFRKPLLDSSFSLLNHGLALLSEPKLDTPYINQIDDFVFARLSEQEKSIIDSYGKQLNNPKGAGGIQRGSFKALLGQKRRVILRNTSHYGDLLRQINRHTRVSMIEEALNALWKLFYDNMSERKLIDLAQAEMLEITHAHIPIFETKIGGGSINAGNNIEIPAGMHHATLSNSISRQTNRECIEDQKFQTSLLNSALKLVRKPSINQHKVLHTEPNHASNVLQKHLMDTRIEWKGDAFWLSLTFHENCTQPSYIIENGLYAGTEGIQLALKLLGENHFHCKSTSLSKNNRTTLKNGLYADNILTHLTSSLLARGCSLDVERDHVELSLRKKIKFVEKQLKAKALNAINSTDNAVIESDIISGLAGLIGGLQSVKAHLKRKEINYISSIQRLAAQTLIDTQQPDGSWLSSNQGLSNLTGWSHGSSGIAAALAVVRQHANQQLTNAIDEAINTAIQHELNHLTSAGDWIDKRKTRKNKCKSHSVGQSWCHGAPGSLLAAVVLHRYEVPFTPDIQKWTELAIDSTKRAKPWSDSLCCGQAGIALIEEIAANEFELLDLQEKAEERRLILSRKTFDQGFNLGPFFPLVYNAPGLFDGIAGIALSLRFKGSDPKIQALLSFGML